MKITLEEKINMDDVRIISKNLSEFNREQAGESNSKDIFISVHDDENILSGGLFGKTGWGWLHIDLIWVSEKCRGKGIGAEILKQAEDEAVKRGCTKAYLDTFSFQAPEFYKKYGYEIFGTLDDMPEGNKRYFLIKSLK